MGGAEVARGFSELRRPLDLGVAGSSLPQGVTLADYLNVPATIATVLSAGKATITELTTTASLQDVWTLVEVIQVDNENRRRIDQAAMRQRR
jgi:hypothetical protein